MAGVIVTILKIIGIVLLSIIGLFLILVLSCLFLPVNYQLWGSKSEEEAKMSLSVNWLFHLIRIRVEYSQENGLIYYVKILFFQLFPREERLEKKDKKRKKRDTEYQESEYKDSGSVKEEVQKEVIQSKDTSHQAEEQGQVEEIKQISSPTKKEPKKEKSKNNSFSAVKKKIIKLKFTFQKICDKIKEICSEYEKWKAFILSEETKGSLSFLNDQRKYLFRRLKPSKADVYLHFGTDDPAVTGKILAALSVFYSFYGWHMDVEPDFEQVCLEGRIYIKGNIQTYILLVIVWRAYKNKHIRSIIQRFRK